MIGYPDGPITHAMVVQYYTGDDIIMAQHSAVQMNLSLKETLAKYSDENHNSGRDIFTTIQIKSQW